MLQCNLVGREKICDVATTTQDWNHSHLAPSYIIHLSQHLSQLVFFKKCCHLVLLFADIEFCAVAGTVSDITTLVQGHPLWIAKNRKFAFSSTAQLWVCKIIQCGEIPVYCVKSPFQCKITCFGQNCTLMFDYTMKIIHCLAHFV